MRLVRYGPAGRERPGLLDAAGGVRDASGLVTDWAGAAFTPAGLARVRAVDPLTLPLVPGAVRLGACVGPGGKIVGVGLNYADHAREAGMPLPTEPVLFMKACPLSGPEDPIWMPPGAEKIDWEIELAVVIGAEAVAVPEARALSHVAGYGSFLDMSERRWQLESTGQWVKGKSFPSFAPIGPWLVTADEVADPQRMSLWLEVNEKRMQASSTAQMVFGVAALVSCISRFMPLYPGDVIATGTPAGVALGQKPTPRWLQAGDRLRAAVDGLGEQRHRLEPWPGAAP